MQNFPRPTESRNSCPLDKIYQMAELQAFLMIEQKVTEDEPQIHYKVCGQDPRITVWSPNSATSVFGDAFVRGTIGKGIPLHAAWTTTQGCL